MPEAFANMIKTGRWDVGELVVTQLGYVNGNGDIDIVEFIGVLNHLIELFLLVNSHAYGYGSMRVYFDDVVALTVFCRDAFKGG